MCWFSVRKGLHYAAAAYLALAIMGTFTLMSFDAPFFEDLAGKSSAQGVFLTSLAQPVECLVASPPRQCLPRTVLPAAFFAAGSGLLYAAVRFITKTVAHNKKSAILLKLRI
jgi:hypothetical protein